MKTILITGSSGFLGARARVFLQKSYDVLAPTSKELNITDEEAVCNFIEKHKPQYIIHSAAISNINTAQENPVLSNAVNKLAVEYIAKACIKTKIKLINLSSDQVYTGNVQRFSLDENIEVNPKNLYARQKRESELLLAEILPSAVSLRLTWMYDSPTSDIMPNRGLAISLLDAYKNNTKFKVNTNQMRSITYIKYVVENLPLCFELPGGVYNYGSENDMPIYELMQYAAKTMGLPSEIIEPYVGDEQNILINIDKIKNHGIIFPSAKDGIAQAL